MPPDYSESEKNVEIARFEKLIADIDNQTSELSSFVKKCIESADENLDTEKGIGLLDVKNHSMINYLIDLSFLMLQKLNKKSIKSDPTILRLAETRVVLERIRPIEAKLKYQIDKYMKLLSSNKQSLDVDPLRFKSNLENFGGEGDSDKDSIDSDDDPGEEKNLEETYVPPKLMAVPYSEERALERAKRRALSSSLVKDLREQYGDAPTEIRDNIDSRRKKNVDSSKKRTEYEENNFMRLPTTKKQRKMDNNNRTNSTLNYLLNFGDYNVEEIVNKNNVRVDTVCI
uniref:Neuroguidin n=1 Tax=Romanomermis culicivorax TaxID=13658 RepID=A0A915L268_ROMCU